MRAGLTRPILGVLLAIAITTTMDANGVSAFSALPLLPLMALFWFLQRFSRREMGFTWGTSLHYGLALLYPILVMGAIAVVAALTGAIDVSETNWTKTAANLALITVSTVLVTILTEEGFFRGWLWASLRRAGLTPRNTLVWTSLAFAAWHISAVVFETGFEPPAKQIPVYLVNATILGAIWGRLRSLSGSIVVASVSHGLWNGMAYALFGFGTHVGALGIENTALYGPEIGALGLGLNAAFFVLLSRLPTRRVAES
jgi:membrane protease YdiL (CAAX protease family)